MRKMALLIVDMQKGVCTSNAYQEKLTIAYIQEMMKACREKQIEVIFIRHDDGAGTLVSKGNEEWEIIEQCKPEIGELIIDKSYNSAFKDTDLHAHLKQHMIDTLCICGMQTELCVDALIKSAFERGYDVLVVNDSFTTVDQEMLSASAMNQFYGEYIWNHRYATLIDLHEFIKRM